MDIVFNELAVSNCKASIYDANSAMDQLLKTVNYLTVLTKEPSFILSHMSLKDIEIGEIYHIRQWLSNLTFDDRSRFLVYTTSKPFIFDYPIYYFQETQTSGFAFACENDLLSASFDPHKKWTEIKYQLKKQYIDETSQEYKEEETFVYHFSTEKHLNDLKEWFKSHLDINVKFKSIKHMEEFWAKRSSIFSNLIFCDGVKEQLKVFSFKDPRFSKAFSKLYMIDSYLSNLPEEAKLNIEEFPGDISNESEATLNQYTDERTFRCPDGYKRVFDWHIKLGDIRIHFLPDTSAKKIIVGYIGKHLRTAKY